MHPALLIPLLLTAATPSLPQPELPECEKTPSRFVLPTAPDAVVLSIHIDSSLDMVAAEYVLLADGRVRRLEGDEQSEAWFSPEEVQDLVGAVVSCGLAQTSNDDFNGKLAEQRAQEVVADGGTITLVVNLDEVTLPGEEAPRQPFRHRVAVKNPPSPGSIPETEALSYVTRRLMLRVWEEAQP